MTITDITETPAPPVGTRPACKHCNTPMTFLVRTRELTSYEVDFDPNGVLFLGDSLSMETSDWEQWWSCQNWECIRTLQQAGGDWPYELEVHLDQEVEFA